MFGLGPFRITNPLSGGLLWKIPWRLSKFQKRRHRLRLRAVDDVVATLDSALAKKGQTLESIERWKAEMPTEAEMLPRDKYTMFSRTAKRYRKGIHSMFEPALPGNEWMRRDRVGNCCRGANVRRRAAQVDKGVPENQPARFLRAKWHDHGHERVSRYHIRRSGRDCPRPYITCTTSCFHFYTCWESWERLVVVLHYTRIHLEARKPWARKPIATFPFTALFSASSVLFRSW
jgi:hypothetical protein